MEQVTESEQIVRLRRQIDQERAARQETEQIAESVTSRLYELVSDLTLFRSALELSPELVAVVSLDEDITFLNKAARDMLLDGEDVLLSDLDYRTFFPQWARDYLRNVVMPAAVAEGSWTGELPVIRHDGLEVPISQIVVWTPPDGINAGLFTVIGRDLTQSKIHEAALRRAAFVDPVCGVPNRAAVIDELDQRHEEHDGDLDIRTTGTLFGLIGAESIKATYGHEAWRRLLIAASDRLQNLIGAKDVLARVGDHQFLVVMTRSAAEGASPVRGLVDGVFAALTPQFSLLGSPVTIRCVAGTAHDSGGGEALLGDAETALEQARTQGPSSHVLFDPSLRVASVARLEIEQELILAVHQGQLVAFYQPVIDVASGRVVGHEALVRWEHPVKGLLSPTAFIDLAEESGAIIELGLWMLREAVKQTVWWNQHRSPDDPLYVSVNLSSHQLGSPGLVPVLAELITELPPHLLQLEITETAALAEWNRTMRDLEAIKSLGVRIAIDDFGTGYSSLTYLQELGADVLKIDRSFVRDLDTQRNRAVASAIVDMARAFDMPTVAEGVETHEQYQQVCALGIDSVQGYFFSPPAPSSSYRPNGELDDNASVPLRPAGEEHTGPRGPDIG